MEGLGVTRAERFCDDLGEIRTIISGKPLAGLDQRDAGRKHTDTYQWEKPNLTWFCCYCYEGEYGPESAEAKPKCHEALSVPVHSEPALELRSTIDDLKLTEEERLEEVSDEWDCSLKRHPIRSDRTGCGLSHQRM